MDDARLDDFCVQREQHQLRIEARRQRQRGVDAALDRGGEIGIVCAGECFRADYAIGEEFRRRPVALRRGLGADRMILECELPAAVSEAMTGAIAASLREVCNLRGDVRAVAPGSLPNDGKVIEDRRTYGT